jgi:hypothetical protein
MEIQNPSKIDVPPPRETSETGRELRPRVKPKTSRITKEEILKKRTSKPTGTSTPLV